MARHDVLRSDGLLAPLLGEAGHAAIRADGAAFPWSSRDGLFMVVERGGLLFARKYGGDGVAARLAAPATPTPGVAAKGLNLVTAKLVPPATPGPLVARPRIGAALREALAHPVTTVFAPVGWGKTAALAEWLRESPFTWAWLSLDAADNRPQRFATYLLAALDRLQPGLLAELYPLAVAGADDDISDVLLSAALVALAAAPDPTVVVVDDCHCIAEDNRPVRTALSFLLERIPPHVHVVLASRSERPLPLARLRAHGRLHDVRPTDLSWTRDEASAYLIDGLRIALSREEVGSLVERTEGWVAGIRLAGQVLQRAATPRDAVAAFTGAHRHVADYFDAEYLDHLEPDLRDFVLRTSILDRFNAPLCDAVCQVEGSQRMLDILARDNPFIVTLNELGRWYRYHHLLADFLRQRLYERSPQLLPELCRRAGAWFESRGDPGAAIAYAMRGPDDDWAVSLVERFPSYATGAELRGAVAPWLSARSEAALRARPDLRALRALIHILDGDADSAERAIGALPGPTGQRPPASDGGQGRVDLARRAALQGMVAVQSANLARGYAKSRAALTVLSRDDPFWRVAVVGLGIAHLMDGEVKIAVRMLGAVRPEAGAVDCDALSITGVAYLGYAYLLAGRLEKAQQLCRDALVAARPELPACCTAIADTVLGLILLERDEPSLAAGCLVRGLASLDARRHVWLASEGYAALGSLRDWQRHPAEAGAVVAQLELTLERGPGWAPRAVGAFRADLLERTGKAEQTREWARGAGRWRDEEGVYDEGEGADAEARTRSSRVPVALDLREQVALARIAMAEGRVGHAIPLLAKTLEIAATAGNVRLALEALTLLGRSYAERGERASAEAVLGRAVAVAEQGGFRRAKATCEAGAAALLAGRGTGRVGRGASRNASGRGQPVWWGDIETFTKAASSHSGDATQRGELEFDMATSSRTGGRSSDVAPVLPRLRAREIEVLRLLAAGASNKDLARELAITLGTVKRHIANIFLELGVRSRTQAIARAHSLRLIGDDPTMVPTAPLAQTTAPSRVSGRERQVELVLVRGEAE